MRYKLILLCKLLSTSYSSIGIYLVLEFIKIKKKTKCRDQSSIATKSKETRDTEDLDIEVKS